MLSSLRPHIERVASGRNEHVENDDPYAAKAPPLTRNELEVIFAYESVSYTHLTLPTNREV